ncbi:MAG: 3-deoxy-D-manno-octulosonic acid transferase, partial [Deltaproteobacteria bacterium]|nr:3-deoxy-D-manno-octulosonic acid transferase [Deltaproteobacteria bacterium]
ARLTGFPRLWIHAVSLGEIQVAASVIRALEEGLPACSVLVSTTTEHGFDSARTILGEEFPLVFAPVDLPFSIRRALQRVRPHALVFLETELWPTWIEEAHALGVRTALVNGRISRRSLDGYLRFRFFFRNVLSRIDAFSMITEGDARRIRAMGADSRRVQVNGNAKYDLLAEMVEEGAEEAVRRDLNLEGPAPVFVAGSTRSGEEARILDAYDRILKAFPGTVLILAPRHIERGPEIAGLARRRGFRCQMRSELRDREEPRTAPVLVLDTFGELFRLYSAATIVFCGASLVPLGGQNPLEPAVWGKPVLYGPHMDDFRDARALLQEQDADGTVTDAEMLAEEAIRLLRSPREREIRGERCRRAVLMNRCAARRHARVVADLLEGASRGPWGCEDRSLRRLGLAGKDCL